MLDETHVGRRVSIYSSQDHRAHSGVIYQYEKPGKREKEGKHLIKYDDKGRNTRSGRTIRDLTSTGFYAPGFYAWYRMSKEQFAIEYLHVDTGQGGMGGGEQEVRLADRWQGCCAFVAVEGGDKCQLCLDKTWPCCCPRTNTGACACRVWDARSDTDPEVWCTNPVSKAGELCGDCLAFREQGQDMQDQHDMWRREGRREARKAKQAKRKAKQAKRASRERADMDQQRQQNEQVMGEGGGE